MVLTSSFDRGSCGRLLVAGRLFAVTTASNTTRSASEGLVWSTRHLWVHGLHDDSYHGNDEAERRGSDHLGIPRKGKNMEKLGTSEEEIVLKLCKGGLLLATHAEVEGSNTNNPRILTEPDRPSLEERRTPVGFFYLARGPDPAPSTQCNSGQRGPSPISRKDKGGQSYNPFTQSRASRSELTRTASICRCATELASCILRPGQAEYRVRYASKHARYGTHHGDQRKHPLAVVVGRDISVPHRHESRDRPVQARQVLSPPPGAKGLFQSRRVGRWKDGPMINGGKGTADVQLPLRVCGYWA